MTYQLIDGRSLSQCLRQQLTQQIQSHSQHVRLPRLAVILIGDLTASHTYVTAKERACQQTGIDAQILRLPASISAEQLQQVITSFNRDETIDGILVQLPLPPHLDPIEVATWLDPSKDVDGLHPLNIGKLTCGDKSGFVPCTPKAIVRLMRYYHIPIQGANITIIGRSLIVGRPLSILLSHPSWSGQASVTLVHSQSRHLKELCHQANILIAAVGKTCFVTEDMVAENAVVIDVGINRNSIGQLCGDVDFDQVQNKVSWITPVPGGVGPMTVAMLLENVVLSWARRLKLTLESPLNL